VEKAEKIVQGSGLFFIFKKRPSTHHVSPRISPRSHHKTPRSAPQFFKTPLKNISKNNKTPASRQGLIFL
jgi:hypothetical protein